MAHPWQHRSTLCPHPAGGAQIAHAIAVDVLVSARVLTLNFVVVAPKGVVQFPAPANPVRADGLWQTSCCEVFLKGAGPDYIEFNLSPSGQWAAYHFSDYRADMAALDLAAAPVIGFVQSPEQAQLSAQIDLSALPTSFEAVDWQMGLSCVVEGVEGAKAYWALNHPPEKPDFHHKDCFALPVRAAERA